MLSNRFRYYLSNNTINFFTLGLKKMQANLTFFFKYESMGIKNSICVNIIESFSYYQGSIYLTT